MNNVRVYVAYIQQPQPQCGFARLEVFRDRDRAVAYLRAEFDRFRASLPSAALQDFATDIGGNVAVGVVRAGFSNWSGRVVVRDVVA